LRILLEKRSEARASWKLEALPLGHLTAEVLNPKFIPEGQESEYDKFIAIKQPTEQGQVTYLKKN